MDRAFQRIRSLMLRGTFYSVPPTFGHSEGSSYFYSRGYLKYLMVEYRLFPVFIIKIRICVQIVNTGIFAKLKDKGYLNTAPAVL